MISARCKNTGKLIGITFGSTDMMKATLQTRGGRIYIYVYIYMYIYIYVYIGETRGYWDRYYKGIKLG